MPIETTLTPGEQRALAPAIARDIARLARFVGDDAEHTPRDLRAGVRIEDWLAVPPAHRQAVIADVVATRRYRRHEEYLARNFENRRPLDDPPVTAPPAPAASTPAPVEQTPRVVVGEVPGRVTGEPSSARRARGSYLACETCGTWIPATRARTGVRCSACRAKH